LDCDPLFAPGDELPAVDPVFTLCTGGCDPTLFAGDAVPEAGFDVAMPACEPLPDAGCDPLFTLGDALLAFAGAGEGKVLAFWAGVGVAFADFCAGAGVAVGLGLDCWAEFPAAVFCAVAVTAKTTASVTT